MQRLLFLSSQRPFCVVRTKFPHVTLRTGVLNCHIRNHSRAMWSLSIIGSTKTMFIARGNTLNNTMGTLRSYMVRQIQIHLLD